MIIITTSSSISVKPPSPPVRALPIMVVDLVQPDALVERVDVVDIIARLRIVGRARVAAQPPALLRRHRTVGEERVARQSPQEVQHRLLLARRVLDARVERLQVRRIARGAQLLRDVAGVGGHLVGIDRAADVPQRRAQLRLLFALGHELRERHGRGRHEAHDRERDDQLDDGEASCVHGSHGSHVGGGAHCDAGWIAILSGGAVLLPTAAPVPPRTFSIAMIVAGRAATALNCSTMRLPLPCTGSSDVVVTSSCAPPPRVSTLGDPAAAGTMSPVLALTSCRAPPSKRSCERRCVIDWSVARRTVTWNSSPTFTSLGPSMVSAERASAAGPPAADPGAGGAFGGTVAGTDVAGRPCCASAALSAAAAAIAVGLDGATTAAPAAPVPGAASGAGGAPGTGAVPAGAGETLGALPEGAVPSGVPPPGAAAGWLSPPAPAP